MHMADALVSPSVAGVAGIISGALLVVAAKKVRNNEADNIVPLMGVMGAFIFAAQMINFSIPGTGSSGHIVGGVLLSAILGPWAGLITLSSVLVIQCLLFADGGLMALGCNILNMAIISCLVAYPLVYRPLVKRDASKKRILWASVLTSVAGLELGAVAVTLETFASGITALPFTQFLLFMVPIHLAIGVCEGLATGAVVCFIRQYKPELLIQMRQDKTERVKKRRFGWPAFVFALSAIILGLSFSWIASSNPDGLEWSISKITGETELPAETLSNVHGLTGSIQSTTALMPDYNTTLAGIIGGILVLAITWGITSLLQFKRKTVAKHDNE